MSQTPADALAALQQVHDNQMALADPQGMLWQAQMNLMTALVSALSASPVASQDTSSVSTNAAAVTMVEVEQAIQTALAAQMATIEQHIGSLFTGASTQSTAATPAATAETPADAAPSSSEPPTIHPTNPGV